LDVDGNRSSFKNVNAFSRLGEYSLASARPTPLNWYRNSIERTAKLSIDFKPTGAAIDETMYPSTHGRKLSSKDVRDLADLFSGKRKCVVKQVYTGDPIIDSIPMAAEYDQAWSEREKESDDYVEKEKDEE
jgi:hypothetical protein